MTTADEMLTWLWPMLKDPDHPAALSVDFTQHEREFLEDVAAIQDAHGDLVSLTSRQVDYLRAIHRQTGQQIASAKALGAAGPPQADRRAGRTTPTPPTATQR